MKKKIKIDLILETIFMIVLILSLPIAVSSLQPTITEEGKVKQNDILNVLASFPHKIVSFFDIIPTASAESWGCCQGIIGDACRMTGDEECRLLGGDWEDETLCEQTTFCEPICCYFDGDGKCEVQTARWVCLQKGGREVGDDPMCSTPMCTLGCCDMTTRYETMNEQECLVGEGIWMPSVNEIECSLLNYDFEEGCCITGGTCEWTKGSECASDNFYKDVFCHDLTQYCNCNPSCDSIGCIEGKTDVYCIDSCGNPNRVADECNYLETGQSCINGECSEGGCSVKLPNSTSINMKNGESICVYDQKLTNFLEDPNLDTTKTVLGKFGIDIPGSRHWKWLCWDGELHIEPCADYRQQICLDATVEAGGAIFREAECYGNIYHDCFQKETKEDCLNAKHGQCWWFGDDPEINKTVNSLINNLENEGKIAEEAKKEKLSEFAGFQNDVSGENGEKDFPKCLPKYSPGYQNFEVESGQQYEPVCFLGNYDCFVKLEKRRYQGNDEWFCTENCECGAYGSPGWEIRENAWLELMAKRCSALGDCGLKVNIVKEYSSGEKIEGTITNILKNTGINELRYFAECEDLNGDGECQEEEVELKEEVDLVELYAGISENEDQRDIINKIGNENLAIKKIIKEIQNEEIYDIYSLEKREFTTPIVFGFGKIFDFIFGIPVVLAALFFDEMGLVYVSGGGKALMTGGTATASTGGSATVASSFSWGGFLGSLGIAIAIGIAAGLAVYGILKLCGVNENIAQAAGWGAGSGAAVGYFLASMGWVSGLGSAGVGLAVAVIVFLIVYFLQKQQKTVVYKFECLPWQPPDGGENCELCDEDPTRPCSEYRCKNLGAACGFACERNKDGECAEGTCFWTDPSDLSSPKIEDIIPRTEGHIKTGFQIGPPGGGAQITGLGGQGINPFETIILNIKTNEKAQCRVDYYPTQSFDEMNYNIGPTLLNPTRYGVDHVLSLELTTLTPEFVVYVRCKDLNGNKNQGGEFKITFISSTEEFDPPTIRNFNPVNESTIDKTKEEVKVTLTLNEPVQGCKWSTTPFISYDTMVNSMDCPNNPPTFKCNSNLPFDGLITNFYYFKCNDSNGNYHLTDIGYVLHPGEPLTITETTIPKLNGSFVGGCEGITEVVLEIQTSEGCCGGRATCFYKEGGNYLEFTTTGETIHETTLEISSGSTNLRYDLLCVDRDSNSVESFITFNVQPDTTAPQITRIYKEGGLIIKTNEDAICAFNQRSQDCSFDIDDWYLAKKFQSTGGTEHRTEWGTEPWYIKCKDECNITNTDNQGCTAIVYPQEI
ncbi:MAG: hypothetical protein JSW08_00180 [archaeon]|nr:MAG: hypothetical protein JSW08_00180 [archaeon]